MGGRAGAFIVARVWRRRFPWRPHRGRRQRIDNICGGAGDNGADDNGAGDNGADDTGADQSCSENHGNDHTSDDDDADGSCPDAGKHHHDGRAA